MDWDEIYKILSHETRRKIILLLGESGSATFTDLSEIEPKPGKLYYHLNLLKGLVTQRKDGSYILTSQGLQVYNLLKSGIPATIEEKTNQLDLGEGSILFLPNFFLRLSVDSTLILSIIILSLYVYLSMITKVAIIPFYLVTTPNSYFITIFSFVLGVGIITLYLKLTGSFKVDILARLIFSMVVSYLILLLPLSFIVYGLYTIKPLFYTTVFLSQIIGLLIFTSGVVTVMNQSFSKSLILPLAIHYINSIINYVTLL